MTVAEKQKQRAKLMRKREALEDKGVEKAHELDVAERRRAELKERDPKIDAIIEHVQAELKENHAEISALRKREDAIDDNVDELTKRIKQLGREIREAKREPKITDLRMAGASSPMGPIKGSIGHYTAGPIARTDDEAVRLWWQVRAQHMGQGWSNIGYHIGLGPEGGIYLLRPLQYAGAHTLGHNTGYVGFSVHGTTGDTWTDAQLAAFEWALKHFNLDDKPVWGHNDFNPTGCPGSFKTGYVSKGQHR